MEVRSNFDVKNGSLVGQNKTRRAKLDNELNITQKATATNDKSQNQTVRSNYPFIKKAWDIMVSYNYTIVEWLLDNKDEFEIDDKEYNRNGMVYLLKPQTYGI